MEIDREYAVKNPDSEGQLVCPDCQQGYLERKLVECTVYTFPANNKDNKTSNATDKVCTSSLFAQCTDCSIRFYINVDTQEIELDCNYDENDILDDLTLGDK